MKTQIFFFSVQTAVQGEVKTPKKWDAAGKFCILPALKIGISVENEHQNECSKPHFSFARLFMFLINSKLAFCLRVS